MNVAGWFAAFRVILVLLVALGALLGLVWSGIKFVRKKQKIKHHPLDDSLREKFASQITWENCALCPEFCEAAVKHYHFLVEEYGFSLPRLEPEAKIMKYRRAEIEILVGEGHTDYGNEVIVGIVKYRSKGSNVIVSEKLLQSKKDQLGDDHRGVAFFLHANLDRVIESLDETS